MKRSLFRRMLTPGLLAVPAAAMMLGAAHAQTTIGINIAGGSYATYGYGAGFPQYYCGFPVTATAFGVDPSNWYTTTNGTTAAFPYNYTGTGSIVVGAASSLTVNLSTPDCWGTWIDLDQLVTNPSSQQVPAPGNDQVLWGIQDNTGWTNSLTGLQTTFPNGYVMECIGAGKVTTSSRITFTDSATFTNTAPFGTIYTGGNPSSADTIPVGLLITPKYTNDALTFFSPSRNISGENSALAGFILTDQPVVSTEPVGVTNTLGSTVSLSAQAFGLTNRLAYQWYLNGSPIAGATSTNYTISPATYAAAGIYDVVVTNLYGATTSSVATVSILAPIVWQWSGATSGTWDIATTGNWKTNGTVTTYSDGVAVQLDDTASTSTVTIAAPVAPYSLEVSNNADAYVIGGAPITGSGGLLKAGTNSLTLNGSNTFSGPIVINAGTVTVGGSGLLGSAGTVVNQITNNGSLVFNNSNGQTLNKGIVGTGKLVQSGTSTNPLVATVNQPLTGGIVVNSGELRVTTGNFGGQFTPSLLTVNSNGTLLSDNYHALGHQTAVFVNKGTWLMNYEDYKTNVTMIDGQINPGPAGNGGELRLGYFANSTVTVSNSMVGSVINEKVNLIGGVDTLNVVHGAAPMDLTINGIIAGAASGGASLVIQGNGITMFATNNTYEGSTTINGGTLILGPNSYVGPGNVTVGSGAVLEGTGEDAAANTVIQSGGTLTVGAPGVATFYVQGVVTLSAGSTTSLKISKTGGTVASDEITGVSSVNFGGTLVVTNVTSDSTALALGDTFQLFSAGGSGGFTAFSLPPLPSGLSWDTSHFASSGTLVVSSQASPPVFNPPAGGYVGALTVTISSLTSGSTIYYTLDGSTPTTSSPHGTSPVSVNIGSNTNVTINAYVTASGYSDSSVQSATYATVPTPTWVAASGGNWSTSGNWSNNVVANAAGEVADISTLTLTANTTISLDVPETVGGLTFADQGNAYNWILADGGGGLLTLNNGSSTPVITVGNTNTTISVKLGGSQGLIKAGAGTLTLATNEPYTGTTVVNNGTLVLDVGGVSGTLSGALTVNSGATVLTAVNNALGYAGSYWVRTINLNGGTLETAVGSDNGWGTTINLTAGTMASTVTNGYFSLGGGPVVNVTGTNVSSVVSANLTARDQIVFNVSRGTTTADLNITGGVLAAGATNGITLNGGGILKLAGTNTYNGPTAVNAGTLFVTGIMGTNSVTTVASGAKVTGNGTLHGAVSVLSGGTLQPGLGGSDTSALTVNSNLTLAGTAVFVINRTASPKASSITGINSLTYGGTLTVTNVGGTLQLGDTFTLFSAASTTGSFSTQNLPALGTGLAWNWNAAAGTLTVATPVNTSPTNVTATVNGSTLTLAWPSDHTGWRLLTQTNNLSTGVSSNPSDWSTVSGSAATNSVDITIDPTKAGGYYRLVYP